MNNFLKKLVEDYEKCTGGDLKVQKTTGALGTTISKSNLEETDKINKYRSFVVKLMRYTANVGPDVENEARELAVQMSYLGTEHWKTLGRLIGYLKGK